MNEPTPRPTIRTDVAVRTYWLICVVALLFIIMQELERGFDVFAFLPFVVGMLGLIMRSALLDILLLVAIAGRIVLSRFLMVGKISWGNIFFQTQFKASDLLLAGAVLAYLMAHYRLIGLVYNIFLFDPRYQEGRPERNWFGGTRRELLQRRSTRLVTPVEWALVLLSLPAFTLLGQLIWATFPKSMHALDLAPWIWRLALPAWIMAILLVIASSLLGYWGRRKMSVREARLLLQDYLWHETRREQRWVNRWLAWDRRRRDRKQELS